MKDGGQALGHSVESSFGTAHEIVVVHPLRWNRVLHHRIFFVCQEGRVALLYGIGQGDVALLDGKAEAQAVLRIVQVFGKSDLCLHGDGVVAALRHLQGRECVGGLVNHIGQERVATVLGLLLVAVVVDDGVIA